MYDRTGMTQDQRDVLIYDLYRRRVTYAKIAKRVGISIGAVQASLRRTTERMTGERI
jgi:DNA-directed RNA polymerase specialized sigma24 family protein